MKLIAVSGLTTLTARSPRLLAAGKDGPDERTLAGFIDTLLPGPGTRDAGPGALDLGIDREILGSLKARPAFEGIVSEGLAWLDAIAQSRHRMPFADLDEQSRIAIVATAEEGAADSVENRLFRTVWRDVRRRYYSKPESWPALGYTGPPQPAGFLDHAQRPEDRG